MYHVHLPHLYPHDGPQGRCFSTAEVAWAKAWADKLKVAVQALEVRRSIGRHCTARDHSPRRAGEESPPPRGGCCVTDMKAPLSNVGDTFPTNPFMVVAHCADTEICKSDYNARVVCPHIGF